MAAFAPGREGSTLAAGGHCKKKNEKMYGHSRSVGQTLVIYIQKIIYIVHNNINNSNYQSNVVPLKPAEENSIDVMQS